MKYISKPVEIEAIQFTDVESFDDMMIIWGVVPFTNVVDFDQCELEMYIETPEGTMTAHVGDYIIKGTEGEFYPCKPSVFERKYEPVRKATDLINTDELPLLSLPRELVSSTDI